MISCTSSAEDDDGLLINHNVDDPVAADAAVVADDAADLSSLAIEPETPTSPQRGRSKSRDRKSLGPEQLRQLPESLEFDIKYDSESREIERR